MRMYIKPEIKISIFDVECVSANETLPLSAPYGQGIDNFINSSINSGNSATIKRNYSFDEAIKFN